MVMYPLFHLYEITQSAFLDVQFFAMWTHAVPTQAQKETVVVFTGYFIKL